MSAKSVPESVTDSVSQVMFATLSGHLDPLITKWSYRSDDPFAMTVAVQTPRGWVGWLVGRELLARGLTGNAGEGDVRVCWQHVHGREVIRITVRTRDGQETLAVDRGLARRFLDATADLVPMGGESGQIDFDLVIAKLTESCSG
jgi:Streptomyces sporulation and cell division protein, SsgA